MMRWKRIPVSVAAAAIWAGCAASTEIERLLGNPDQDGVRIISIVMFSVVILGMLTERGGWPLWKRVGFVPAAFLAHVALTIPASAALGVLMYSPDHLRTAGEQRGVFILAAIPVIVCAMWRSKLFIRAASVGSEDPIDDSSRS